MTIELKPPSSTIGKHHLYWLIPLWLIVVAVQFHLNKSVFDNTLTLLVPLIMAGTAYLFRQRKWIANIANGYLSFNHPYFPEIKESAVIKVTEIRKIIIAGNDAGMVIAIKTKAEQIELIPRFSQISCYLALGNFLKSNLPSSIPVIEREKPSIFESQHGLYLE
jgi:hypothetical protein